MSFDGEGRGFVGYGNPPVEHRFQKGASGNPAGRPRLKPSLANSLERELNETIFATENGTRKKITKKQVIAKQLTNKAVGGDLASIKLLLTFQHRIEQQALLNAAAVDRKRWEDLDDRIRRSTPEENERRIHELLAKAGYGCVPLESRYSERIVEGSFSDGDQVSTGVDLDDRCASGRDSST